MEVAIGVTPVGINIPFGHGAVGMGPDHFVLSADGFSSYWRPAGISIDSDAVSASRCDVIPTSRWATSTSSKGKNLAG